VIDGINFERREKRDREETERKKKERKVTSIGRAVNRRSLIVNKSIDSVGESEDTWFRRVTIRKVCIE
jgi:hypothetical protein